MIYYILTAVVAFIIAYPLVYIISVYRFMRFVEIMSEKNESYNVFGVNYFFMTKDQIQNAVKAVISLETEYNKPEKMEIN